MKHGLSLRIRAVTLAACLCLSVVGCVAQPGESSGTPSSSQASSSEIGSQPDIVGSSQAPMPEAQSSMKAPKVSIVNKTDNHFQQKIAVPHFSGFVGVDELNSRIEKEQQDGIAEVQNALDGYEEQPPETPLLYQSVFDYQENGLLSVWLTNGNYTGGAHGMDWIRSYNLDPKTGEFYAFRDLFRKPDEAVPQITEQILTYLKSSITDDPDGSLYQSAEQAVQALKGNYSYYLDGENLIVYFQPYDVLPYAAGIVRVPISLSSLPDMTVSLHAVSTRKTIRVNGQNTDLNRNMMMGSEGADVLLPMPEAARLCGVEATVKNQVCTIGGKEYPVTYANGGAFMTLSDFLSAVPDDESHLVIYGPDDILRIYAAK